MVLLRPAAEKLVVLPALQMLWGKLDIGLARADCAASMLMLTARQGAHDIIVMCRPCFGAMFPIYADSAPCCCSDRKHVESLQLLHIFGCVMPHRHPWRFLPWLHRYAQACWL